LTWTDNSSNEIGFVIQRKVSPDAYADLDATNANDNNYDDYDVVFGTNYCYRVRARGCTDSGYSNEVCITHSSSSSSSSSSSGGDCSANCDDCCSSYVFTITGPGAWTNTFTAIYEEACSWSLTDAVISCGAGIWILTITNDDGDVGTWHGEVSGLCPPSQFEGWTFISNTFGGTPPSIEDVSNEGCGGLGTALVTFSNVDITEDCMGATCGTYDGGLNLCSANISDPYADNGGSSEPSCCTGVSVSCSVSGFDEINGPWCLIEVEAGVYVASGPGYHHFCKDDCTLGSYIWETFITLMRSDVSPGVYSWALACGSYFTDTKTGSLLAVGPFTNDFTTGPGTTIGYNGTATVTFNGC
jgi:hypothetical protein